MTDTDRAVTRRAIADALMAALDRRHEVLDVIVGSGDRDEAIDAIRGAFPERPHVFNLGHGILLDTPIAHVERLLAAVRA